MECCGDGPIYHPYLPFQSQVDLFVGFEQTTNILPGGASGVVLNWNFAFKCANADNFGLDLAALNKFSARNNWYNNLSDSVIVKLVSRLDMSYFKLFLNVCMDHSAELARCIWEVTNWNLVLLFSISFCNYPDVSLSKFVY